MSRKPNRNARPSRSGLPRWASWVLILAAIVALGYVLIPNGGTERGGIDSSPEAVSKGQALFAQHCATCHGEGAVGQNPDSPMGGVTEAGTYIAPAMNGTGHAWHHPPDALFRVVKHGSPAENSPMKGWSGTLSDAEVRAVLGYLHSLWPEELRRRYDRHHGR